MADQHDPRPAGVGGTQVPDLIERYRLRRDEWIAQADELARLRDEVRGAAEHEAMEIVTAARRDVRQVIMEARRELLVLSAQVQAALGEVSGKADPASLLKPGSSETRTDSVAPGFHALSAGEHPADIFVPEAAVKTMLDEARADMEALAEDAKTVPFQATILAATPEPEVAPALPEPSVAFESFASLTPSTSTYPGPPSGSRVLLSSPFPSDSVAVPQTRSIRTFVSLFVIIGALVLGGSIWWLRGRDASPAAATARPHASEPAASIASSAPAPTPVTTPVTSTTPAASVVEAGSGPLSLVVEARRSSWIRTTLDGQSDAGRTYEAGETVRLNARQGVLLRVGDAGAVYVSVNKGEAKPLGRDGQVITRQFVVEERPTTATASAAPNPAPTAPALARGPAAGAAPSLPPTQGLAPPPSNPAALVQPTVAAAPNAPAIEPPPSTARAIPPVPARPETAVPLPRTEVATAPAPPAAAAPATAVVPLNSNTAVVAAARQWLDAYHRQERSLMSSLSTENMQLADERRADERFPSTVEVNRTLDKVSVQIAADTAVLTAVMTESGPGGQRVSPISQVWVLSGGQWRVRQVRLVSEARLNQIFR